MKGACGGRSATEEGGGGEVLEGFGVSVKLRRSWKSILLFGVRILHPGMERVK